MTLRFLISALLLGLGSPALAAEWQADAAASSLRFSSKVEGEAFTGQFDEFSPHIVFDPENLAASRFEVEIVLASADSQSADRDDTLLGNDFFAVKHFPIATYSASAFRDLGQGRFAADGTLSLRGVEKPVTLTFTWVQSDGSATLDGKAQVNRLDFNIGAGDWADANTIAHEVDIATTLKLSSK